MQDRSDSTVPAHAPRRVALRVGLLAAIWWLLNPDEAASWVVGAPVLAAATWAASRLARRQPFGFALRGALAFAPYFLLSSLRGGIDVAWRAIRPEIPIQPALLSHRLRLPEGTARTFLIETSSLLPGSLSADCRNAVLLFHVLNDSREAARSIAELEERVAALFGIDLREPEMACHE